MDASIDAKADAWRERIAAQRGSGQSIRGWCRDNNQAEHAFYWWRVRLGLGPKSVRRRGVGRPRFTEVVVDRPAAQSQRAWTSVVGPPLASVVESFCLRLGNGRELILPASMPPEQLAKLVHAIEVKPSGIQGKPSGIQAIGGWR